VTKCAHVRETKRNKREAMMMEHVCNTAEIVIFAVCRYCLFFSFSSLAMQLSRLPLTVQIARACNSDELKSRI